MKHAIVLGILGIALSFGVTGHAARLSMNPPTANYFLDWSRVDPASPTISTELLLPARTVMGRTAVAVGKIVSYQGRDVIGVRRTTTLDPSTAYFDTRGGGTCSVSVQIHTFGDITGDPIGSVCTVIPALANVRTNSMDGLRRDQFGDLARDSSGAVIQDVVIAPASDGSMIVSPGAKRRTKPNQPYRWIWPSATVDLCHTGSTLSRWPPC